MTTYSYPVPEGTVLFLDDIVKFPALEHYPKPHQMRVADPNRNGWIIFENLDDGMFYPARLRNASTNQ